MLDLKPHKKRKLVKVEIKEIITALNELEMLDERCDSDETENSKFEAPFRSKDTCGLINCCVGHKPLIVEEGSESC